MLYVLSYLSSENVDVACPRHAKTGEVSLFSIDLLLQAPVQSKGPKLQLVT